MTQEKHPIEDNTVKAGTYFVPEDIKTLRPNWSEERCEDWLSDNARYFEGLLSSTGFDILEDLIASDEA